jgi:hypothetical protein
MIIRHDHITLHMKVKEDGFEKFMREEVVPHFGDHYKGPTLDQGEHAVAAFPRAPAHHRVDLPVAELTPPLHPGGPLPNHSFPASRPRLS